MMAFMSKEAKEEKRHRAAVNICAWIVRDNQPIWTVTKDAFRRMVAALSSGLKPPSRDKVGCLTGIVLSRETGRHWLIRSIL